MTYTATLPGCRLARDVGVPFVCQSARFYEIHRLLCVRYIGCTPDITLAYCFVSINVKSSGSILHPSFSSSKFWIFGSVNVCLSHSAPDYLGADLCNDFPRPEAVLAIWRKEGENTGFFRWVSEGAWLCWILVFLARGCRPISHSRASGRFRCTCRHVDDPCNVLRALGFFHHRSH